jgi:hypothetical protein
MYKRLLLGLLLVQGLSASAEDLSPRQIAIAERIYSVARTAPNKYGDTFERTLVQIAMQESYLGEVLVGDLKPRRPLTSASLGWFHFRIETVRHLQALYPEEIGWLSQKSDQWIAESLKSNEELNLVLAILNVHRLSESKLTQRSKFKIISMWNGGVNNPSYVRAVNKHQETVLYLISNNFYSE